MLNALIKLGVIIAGIYCFLLVLYLAMLAIAVIGNWQQRRKKAKRIRKEAQADD